ncbi:expressed protein [Phakopsora pachyrhizi]|uniref:Expressed protein n=1 Tax=Phakopsora pachyrhizi TaxID=170000 RepID=A0AAV0BIJ2_PHAPC|nr:expressed protein [Phakopsora pachyrhizi]
MFYEEGQKLQSNLKRFRNIIGIAKSKINKSKEVYWKIPRPNNPSVLISDEDYQSITFEFLPNIRNSIVSLQNLLDVQDSLTLNPSSPIMNMFSFVSELLIRINISLKNVLETNRLKNISHRAYSPIATPRILLVAEKVNEMRNVWLTLLSGYESYFELIFGINSKGTQPWTEIILRSKKIIDAINSSFYYLTCSNEKFYVKQFQDLEDKEQTTDSDLRNVRRLDPAEVEPNKYPRLDTADGGEPSGRPRYRLGRQLSKIQRDFSSIHVELKNSASVEIKPKFDLLFPRVSQRTLKLITSEYLPTLRSQITFLRESFELKNFSCYSDEIQNDRSIIKLPNQVDDLIKMIRTALNSLVDLDDQPEDHSDSVILSGPILNLFIADVHQLSSSWLSLSKSFKDFLHGIYLSLDGKIEVEPSLGQKMRSKSDELLNTIDEAMDEITCPQTVGFRKDFKFLGCYLSDLIKSNNESFERILLQRDDEYSTDSDGGDSGEDECNGNKGCNGCTGDQLGKRSERDRKEYNGCNFLMSWNRVLDLLKSLILKISEDSPSSFHLGMTASKLSEGQVLILGHEFERWTTSCRVEWDGDGWGVSSDVDFEETVKKLLGSIKFLRDKILLVGSMRKSHKVKEEEEDDDDEDDEEDEEDEEDDEDEDEEDEDNGDEGNQKNTEEKNHRSNELIEMLKFDEFVSETEVDRTDEEQMWIKGWIKQVVKAIDEAHRADKLYWDQH